MWRDLETFEHSPSDVSIQDVWIDSWLLIKSAFSGFASSRELDTRSQTRSPSSVVERLSIIMDHDTVGSLPTIGGPDRAAVPPTPAWSESLLQFSHNSCL